MAHVYQLHTLLATVSNLYQYPQHVREPPSILIIVILLKSSLFSYAFANLDDVRFEKKTDLFFLLPC